MAATVLAVTPPALAALDSRDVSLRHPEASRENALGFAGCSYRNDIGARQSSVAAAPDVLSGTDGLKMIRVDAGPHATQMIELDSARNRSVLLLVGKAMGQHHPAVYTHLPVSAAVLC
jgi:hypothetical protein